MKIRWNPLLASTLALTGAAALLAGCDKPETPPPAPKAESSAPPPVAAVEPPPAAAPAPEAPAAGTDTAAVDDATLATRVQTALQADPETQPLAIAVDSREGVVQLSGFVDSQAQTDKAAQIAQAVPGVRGVDNKLATRATADAAPAAPNAKVSAVDDSAITGQLKESLLGDPYLNNIDVAVVTRDGEVQLSGFVSNQDQADDVIAAARRIEGVKNVVSTLSVGSGGQSAQPGDRPVEPSAAEQQPAEPSPSQNQSGAQ